MIALWQAQPVFDVVWQFAIFTAAVHLVLLKVPQQADSSLQIFKSWSVGMLGVLIFLAWRAVPLPKGVLSVLLFNTVFLPLVFVLQVLYNVYFRHRGIPGSFWYKATDLPYPLSIFTPAGYFKTSGLRKLQELHSQLGDVIRIQPNHISFNTIAAIEDIHGVRTKTSKREPFATLFGSETGITNIFSTTYLRNWDKARHDFLRRTLQPSFNTSTLDLLSPTIEDFVKRVVLGLGKEADENDGIVEISNWIYNFTFSVIGALTWGTDFNGLRTREPHRIVTLAFKWFKAADMYMFLTWAAKIKYYLPFSTWQFRKAQKQIEAFALACINAEIDNCETKEHKTLLLFMKRAHDPKTGESLSRDDLIINGSLLLAAGSLSTGNTLTHFFKLLLTNPRTWHKLCQEIRESFHSIDEINSVKVRKLPYLDMVLSEGMRFGASLPFGTPRLTPPEGAVIAGIPIAGDTYVSIPNFTLHRNPNYFSNPESFIPERWGDNSMETCDKKAFLAWGHGPHECLGKWLAIMELKMLMCAIILSFDMEWADACQDPMADIWSQVDPVHLKLHRRAPV